MYDEDMLRAMSEDEVRVQYLRPGELLRRKKAKPIIYLPLGPLEWHGPHCPLGVDAINAEQLALGAARCTGGVVLPTLYMGTERERPPSMLKWLGFKPDAFVEGMEFPKVTFRSFYFREEVFAVVLRNYMQMVIGHGYRLLYVVNGHGATNHLNVIERLIKELNAAQKTTRILCLKIGTKAFGGLGHADAYETSVMRYYDPSLVDLNALPSTRKVRRLKYADYAIVDDGGFSGKPGPGHTISPSKDPRYSTTTAKGREFFSSLASQIVRDIHRAGV